MLWMSLWMMIEKNVNIKYRSMFNGFIVMGLL